MSPGVTLTQRLVAARSLPGLGGTLHPASCSEEMPALQAVHLDRENICTIGRVGRLPGIHSLYLQRNRIEKIENLDCFPNLQFLSLAGNCIRKVENLQPLQHLRFLDLSHNQIQTLDAERGSSSCQPQGSQPELLQPSSTQKLFSAPARQ